jgi:DNA-binding response OmpR family regulator
VKSNAESPALPEPSPISDARMSLPRTPHVLIVDDETTIRITLRRFFERLGWVVDEAADGETALVMLLASSRQRSVPDYHAVICDVRMPGVDGVGMHQRLAQERPDLLSRIIFVTGDLVSEDVALFLESTWCLVLQKPFEFAQLQDLMTRLMDDGATSEALAS